MLTGRNMYWLIPAIIVPLIGLAAYVPRRISRRMQSALLIKCALSVGFILYALWAAYRLSRVGTVEPWAVTIALFTLAGMVFGLLGDVWLDLKDMDLTRQTYFMFAGFSCFMIGHVMFVIGMGLAYRPQGWVWPVAVAVGLAVAGINLALEKPLGLRYGRYRTILAVYAAVIGIATVIPVAHALAIHDQAGHSWQPAIFAVGMVLFLLSDLVLSQIYFRTDPAEQHRPRNYVLNYLFYFGAQYALALSLYFLPYAGLPERV